MFKHENSFSVKGNIQKIYDFSEKYFLKKGYSVESSHKPNRLALKKKGSRWANDIRKNPHDLYVTFIDGDNISVVMTYIFHAFGFYTPNTKKKLNSDISTFKEKIQNSPALFTFKCPYCNRENPKDANYCNNCGKQLDKTRAYI
ncbi:MAG: zinc ribbon domain-containing protein [Candidatus Methanofastidiosia archaeon]|jgi:hypothetical protein